jgi:hypothetical protein
MWGRSLAPGKRRVRPPNVTLCARATELVAVNADGVGCWLQLPRPRAHAPPDLGQKQAQRLLDGVPPCSLANSGKSFTQRTRYCWCLASANEFSRQKLAYSRSICVSRSSKLAIFGFHACPKKAQN